MFWVDWERHVSVWLQKELHTLNIRHFSISFGLLLAHSAISPTKIWKYQKQSCLFHDFPTCLWRK